MTKTRKPARKFPTKIMIRSIYMSELSPLEQVLIKKGLADMKANRVKELKAPKNRGLKIQASATAAATLGTIPAADLNDILQHIVNHTAAARRRKNTKPRLTRKTR